MASEAVRRRVATREGKVAGCEVLESGLSRVKIASPLGWVKR